MVRGVLFAIGLILLAGAARADEPPADAPPAAESPAPAPAEAAPPADATPATAPPAAEAAPAETPPPPAPPVLQAYAPIRPAQPPAVQATAPVEGVDNDDPARFVVGQVWTLKAPAPSSLRVVIGRVDELGGRTIVSVSLLAVPCPESLGCETTDIAHMPFDRATLTAAVDHVVARDGTPLPDFAQGYRYWRDNGRGAAWSLPPAEAAAEALAAMPRRAASAPALARPEPPPPPEPAPAAEPATPALTEPAPPADAAAPSAPADVPPSSP